MTDDLRFIAYSLAEALDLEWRWSTEDALFGAVSGWQLFRKCDDVPVASMHGRGALHGFILKYRGTNLLCFDEEQHSKPWTSEYARLRILALVRRETSAIEALTRLYTISEKP